MRLNAEGLGARLMLLGAMIIMETMRGVKWRVDASDNTFVVHYEREVGNAHAEATCMIARLLKP